VPQERDAAFIDSIIAALTAACRGPARRSIRTQSRPPGLLRDEEVAELHEHLTGSLRSSRKVLS
jgi:hypothetical protein